MPIRTSQASTHIARGLIRKERVTIRKQQIQDRKVLNLVTSRSYTRKLSDAPRKDDMCGEYGTLQKTSTTVPRSASRRDRKSVV